jgi:hypothetical protein
VVRAALDPRRLDAALGASGMRASRRRELLSKLGVSDVPADGGVVVDDGVSGVSGESAA